MTAMANEVRDQIVKLVKLQGIELEIRKIEQVLGQVDGRTAELDAQLNQFVTAVETGKAKVQELTKVSRALDADLEMNQGRVAKSQEKLRSVKTNKEYQSGLKEIEDLGAIVSKIEDDILGCLDQIEASSRDLKDHQARLDTQAERIRVEKEAVRRDAQEARGNLQRLQEEAAHLAGRLPAEVLSLYRRVQSKKTDGVAIASVGASVCRGCNVNIPPQMYNELQRVDRLKNCPNCERIIYWDDEEGRSE
jgi:predicted  nucleic acid-binding Zn-ribbon protein